jgi:membrane-bound lytic murein transglycosylase D
LSKNRGSKLLGNFLFARILVLLLAFGASSSVIGETRVPFGSDGGPEASSPDDPDNGAFGLPAVLRDEDPATDPSVFDDTTEILPERYLLRSVPWSPPDYSGQEGSLGWQPDVFRVPPELASRVAFWKDIYAKYTTDQGVMHDIDDITIVYEVLDFKAIMQDAKMSLRAKARARTKLVKSHRDAISKRLERLAKMKSEKDLRDESDRKTLAHFTPIPAPSLFLKENQNELKDLRKRIQTSSKKRKIRFQLGQKDKFILGVYYSGRYLRSMEKVFRAERLPIELTRLPFVESSFNVLARSRVGASGVWQFMPRTARPSMMVNRDVDERNDPATATHAAARLMRTNFELLRSWPLALTAYNHGAAGVARAVRKAKSRDLSVIIDNYSGRRFGFASSNFFACFLAALEVEKEARSILGDVKWSLEFDGSEVDVIKAFSWKLLVDFYDGESALAELQNPHLTSRVRAKGKLIPKGTFVRVPTSRLELARDFVGGRISEEALHNKLAITPIPRMTTSEGREGSLRSKIGAVSEAAKALLPFLTPSPPSNAAPAPSSGE